MAHPAKRSPRSLVALAGLVMSWSHLVAGASDWGCNQNNVLNSGTYTQLTDCVEIRKVTVVNDLSLTGRPGLTTITVKSGYRHFQIGTFPGVKLELKWIKLTASYVDSGGVKVTDGTLHAIDCWLDQNRNGQGGGIEAIDGVHPPKPTIVLDHTNITGNIASGFHGGGVYQSGGFFTMSGGVVKENSASDSGGGLYFTASTEVTITNTIITSNSASRGGGLYLLSVQAVLTRVNLTNNMAQYGGGGIYVAGTLQNPASLNAGTCHFYSNSITTTLTSSNFGGAALQAREEATIIVRQSAFVNNYATNGRGHLVYTYTDGESPAVTIVNTKITLCALCALPTAFWGGNADGTSNQYQYVSTSTCSSSPCTVAPFTGTCVDRTDNYGVMCKFPSSSCDAGTSVDFSEAALPPPTVPVCKACDPGMWSSSESLRCSICPHGQWQNLTGANTCNKCDPGKYLSDPGTSSDDHTGESQCLLCEPGFWSSSEAANECIETCPSGRYGNARGQSSFAHACPGACAAGKYGTSFQPDESVACKPCEANHYQALVGQTECDQCPSGQFTREYTSNALVYHNNATDCHLLPRVTRVLPSSSGTAGNRTVSIYGHNFFNGDVFEIRSHGNVWLSPVYHNNTWITAIVPPGVGAESPIFITIDGLASLENLANFSYLPPNISSLISPPFEGGSIQIFGKNFGNALAAVNIVVDNGECARSCTGPELFDDHLLCQYDEIGAEGVCRGVTVTVSGQRSNRVKFCYDTNKGEITGLPIGVQDVFELKSKSYNIGLSLTPKATVEIRMSATASDSSFSCAVLPSTVTFLTNSTGPQSVVVTTVGNLIDEGTDATVYTCDIVHMVTSVDEQYSTSPDRKVTIRVINDDVADIKLWTVDPADGTFDYAVKFIGPLCSPEGGNVSYGIRLDTEPRATVTVSVNAELQKKDLFKYPPTMDVAPRRSIVFNSYNWNKTQRVILHSVQDDIVHAPARFKVTHAIETTDAEIYDKANARPAVVLVDVADDDDAGIDMLSDDSAIALTEGGESVTVTLAKLRSRPIDAVNVSVVVPSVFIVPGRRQISIPHPAWDRVDQSISFRALIGAPSGGTTVFLQPRSVDRNYNTTKIAVRLNIVVTPLDRRLTIPEKATVTEGSTYRYSAKLTTPLAAGSMVALNVNTSDRCRIERERPIIFTSANATDDVLISIVANDNFVDEGGPDVISFTCSIVHVLKNIGGGAEYHNQIEELKLSVQNNDHADIKVQLYSPDSTGNEAKLKVLGPLCVEEGKNVTYGVVLTSEPSAGIVRVVLNVEATRVSSPLILQVFPPIMSFDATNWGVPRPAIVRSSRDFVDNDMPVEGIRVLHDIDTGDRVFRLTATRAVTTLQVTDDAQDVAGLDVEPNNGILELSQGQSKAVRLLRFRTRPIHNVNITARLVNVPPGLASITSSLQQEFQSSGNWRNVSISFIVHAHTWNTSIYVDMMEFVVGCHSVDSKYDSVEKRLELNIVDLPIDVPVPEKPKLRRVANAPSAVAITWSYLYENRTGNLYEVEWNQGDNTFISPSNSFKTTSRSIIVNAPLPLSSSVVYVRVRLDTARPSPWSLVSDGWDIAKNCDFVREYLNTSNRLESWRCMECPLGASCVGQDVTWKDVKTLFGWWRNEIWTEDAASNFTICSFPPACLGAKNKQFEKKFVLPEDEVDYAAIDYNETCNSNIGYAVTCGRNSRCRLCGTCKEGYRRRETGGTARCDKCPDSSTNKVLLGLGGVLVFLLLGFLVIQHIKKGGRRTLTGMQKMIVINYFQLTYMIANMDVPWPDALRIMFDVEGAVSTIGEHLLNPACELTHIPAANVIFHKQIVYLFLLPSLIIFAKALWRLHAWWQGRPFRYRGTNLRSPSHKDGSVATIVFLIYLVYPTLCRQAFALLVCHQVDGKWYMKIDLQEQCFVGRHFTYLVCCTLPQIVLHVFGIPLLGLRAAWRGFRGNNKKMLQSISMFRYGMLYSAYNERRWYWGIVISSRKAIVAFITSFISDPALEIHWLILYLALQILVNTIGQQHVGIVHISEKDAQFLQLFDSLTLFLLLVTSWSGLFFNLTPTCGDRQYGCLAMLLGVTLLNAGFFLYCLYLFRTYIAAQSRYIFCYICRKWAKKKTKGGLRRTKKRSSTHANPLSYRKSMVEGKTIINPFARSTRLCKDLKFVEMREKKRTQSSDNRVGALNAPNTNAMLVRLERAKRIKALGNMKGRQRLMENGPHISDWFKVVDSKNPGTVYYCNRNTNEVRWDLPSFPDPQAMAQGICHEDEAATMHENPMSRRGQAAARSPSDVGK